MKKLITVLIGLCAFCCIFFAACTEEEKEGGELDGLAVTVTASETQMTYSPDAQITLTADLSDESKEALSAVPAAYSYRWYKDGAEVAEGAGTALPATLILTEVAESGTYTLELSATYGEQNAEAVSNAVTVTIGKAAPSEEGLTDITATVGQTLADVSLPNGWAFKDADDTPVGAAGENIFTVVFAENANYTAAEKQITVTVSKGYPDLSVLDGLSLTATYGDTLADVTLPSGWAFKSAGDTAVGEAGENVFDVVFAETEAYYAAEGRVSVLVAKATPVVSIKEEYSIAYTFENTLGEVALPAEDPGTWAWKEAGADTALSFGENTFTAVFTPNDTKNYNSVERTVTVNVVYNTETLKVQFKEGYEVNTVVTAGETFAVGDWGDVLAINAEPAEGGAFSVTSYKIDGKEQEQPNTFASVVVASGSYYEFVISVTAKGASGDLTATQYLLVRADDCYITTFDTDPVGSAPSDNFITNGRDNNDTNGTRTVADVGGGNHAFAFTPKDSRLNLNWVARNVPAGSYDIIINFRFDEGLTRIFVATDLNCTSVLNGQDINTANAEEGSLVLFGRSISGPGGRYGFQLWCQSSGTVYVESIVFRKAGSVPAAVTTFEGDALSETAGPEGNFITNGAARAVVEGEDGTKLFRITPEGTELNCNWLARDVAAGTYNIKINFVFPAGLTRIFIATDTNYNAVLDEQDIFHGSATTEQTSGSLTLFNKTLGTADARYPFQMFCNTTSCIYVESIEFYPVPA